MYILVQKDLSIRARRKDPWLRGMKTNVQHAQLVLRHNMAPFQRAYRHDQRLPHQIVVHACMQHPNRAIVAAGSHQIVSLMKTNLTHRFVVVLVRFVRFVVPVQIKPQHAFVVGTGQ